MMASIDILASAVEDLLPTLEESFIVGHALMTYITKGSRVEKSNLQSYIRDFAVVTGGPGQVIGVPTGGETISATRRQKGVRGHEYAYRMIYAYAVPCVDLSRAGGPKDIAKILKNYPTAAQAEFMQLVNAQIARGAGSSGASADAVGCKGILTLNGDQNYNPTGLANRTGIFQYAAKASQTATIHDLPMEGAVGGTFGWYHQYEHISGFAADQGKALRKIITRANHQGKDLEGTGVDLILCDEASFHNYCEVIDDKFIRIDTTTHPLAKHLAREGIKIGQGTDIYWEPDIDITDTTSFTSANPRLGVMYIFTTADWEIFFQAQNSDKASNGNFDSMGPILLPDQDAWQFRTVADMNLCCHALRRQGCLTGGAQE